MIMSHRARLVLSAVIALLFLIFSYWVTNLNYPISGEKQILCYLEAAREYLRPGERKIGEEIVCVDVTFDKVLCAKINENKLPLGQVAVTDRQKLLKLLRYLKEENNYRYILLDVFFADGVSTEWDEELFETIISMPRIVVPCHIGENIADKRLLAKAGVADYKLTLSESDFVKYPYVLSDSLPSIPIKMYEELTGHKINKHWIFYNDGWRLARKSIVLTFEAQIGDSKNKVGGSDMVGDNALVYKLGLDLLDDESPDMDNGLLSYDTKLMRDKYVIIGSFYGDDMHNTYVGKVPGALILFNAYKSLLDCHHIVSILFAFILYLIFFTFSYFILSRIKLSNICFHYAYKTKYWPVRIVMKGLARVLSYSWVEYSLLLSIMCIITYLLLGEVYDIFITSTLFSLFNFIVKHSKRIKFYYIRVVGALRKMLVGLKKGCISAGREFCKLLNRLKIWNIKK